MLVLGRKSGERVLIGDGIVLTVTSGYGAQIGFDASKSIEIKREELCGYHDHGTFGTSWIGRLDVGQYLNVGPVRITTVKGKFVRLRVDAPFGMEIGLDKRLAATNGIGAE